MRQIFELHRDSEKVRIMYPGVEIHRRKVHNRKIQNTVKARYRTVEWPMDWYMKYVGWE